MRHAQPPALPGWSPMTTPPRNGGRFPRAKRQAIIVGGLTLVALFTGILATPKGWLAVGLAWAVVGLVGNHRAQGHTLRTLVEYAAVAALAVIVVTAGATPPATTKQVRERAPKVEAAQGGQLQELREGVASLFEQIAKGSPAPEKEGR